MKKLFLMLAATAVLVACGPKKATETTPATNDDVVVTETLPVDEVVVQEEVATPATKPAASHPTTTTTKEEVKQIVVEETPVVEESKPATEAPKTTTNKVQKR